MTRELNLVVLFRRFRRHNPVLRPQSRGLWAKAHVFAAARCCAAVPSLQWAGKILIDAGSGMELPNCWLGPAVGSMRSHARDCGGVTAHAVRILAGVVVDHHPECGIPPDRRAAEIVVARRWAACHWDFVRNLLSLSASLQELESETEIAHFLADQCLSQMELREEPAQPGE